MTFRTFLQVLLGGPEALAQRAPRVFDVAAATQVPGLRGDAGTRGLTSLDVDGSRLAIAQSLKESDIMEQLRGKIAAGLQARGLIALSVENSARFQESGKKIDAEINAAVSATGNVKVASRGMYNGQSCALVIDETTPGFNDPSKTISELMAAQFARVLVAKFGLTQEAAEQWVAEHGNVQSLVDQHLFVSSGGNTFVRGDPRNLAPRGWITIAMMTEITGERAALSSLDVVSVELYINELRQRSIESGVPITLRQALQGDIAKNLPGVRQMLRVLDGYGLSVEGYDQFGARYPASVLLDKPLTDQILSGLSLRVFDPPTPQGFDLNKAILQAYRTVLEERSGLSQASIMWQEISRTFTPGEIANIVGQDFLVRFARLTSRDGRNVETAMRGKNNYKSAYVFLTQINAMIKTIARQMGVDIDEVILLDQEITKQISPAESSGRFNAIFLNARITEEQNWQQLVRMFIEHEAEHLRLYAQFLAFEKQFGIKSPSEGITSELIEEFVADANNVKDARRGPRYAQALSAFIDLQFAREWGAYKGETVFNKWEVFRIIYKRAVLAAQNVVNGKLETLYEQITAKVPLWVLDYLNEIYESYINNEISMEDLFVDLMDIINNHLKTVGI